MNWMKMNLVRNVAICLAFASASLGLFASPAATQQWVKNYVSSNVTQTIEAKTSAFTSASWQSVDEDGNEVTVTITFNVATNDGIVVFDSNVPGVTNGTRFAKVGDNWYRNLKNVSCTDITGSVEKQFTYYGDGYVEIVTNATPYVTNTVYATSNDVYGVTYGFDVAGVRFAGSDLLTGYSFFCATNNAALKFKTKAVKLTDAERNYILTAATASVRRFSILDLIFPPCYAYTYSEKEYTGNVDKEYPGGSLEIVKYEYYEHAYTDSSDAMKVTLGTIKVGETITYDMSGITVLEITGGWHIEDLKKQLNAITVDQINAYVKEKVGAVRWRIHFENSSMYSQKMAEVVGECNSVVEKYKAVPCPIGPKWDVTETTHKCSEDRYASFTGKCGDWICTKCGKHWKSVDSHGLMAEHSWNQQYGGCQVCANPSCDYVNPDESGHTGWHNYGSVDDCECVCNCGYFGSVQHLAHCEGEIVGWIYGGDEEPNLCVRVEKCGRCKTTVGSFNNKGGGTWYQDVHFVSATGKFVQITTNGEDRCATSQICNHRNDAAGNPMGCGILFNEYGSHVDCNLAQDCEEIDGDNENHLKYTPCMNGFVGVENGQQRPWTGGANTNWCGYCFTNEVAHNYNSDDFFLDLGTNHGVIAWCVNEDGETDYKHCGHQHQKRTEAHHYVTTNAVFLNSAKHRLYQHCRECYHPSSTNESHSLTLLTYGNPRAITHDVTNYCGVCDTEYFAGASNHVLSTARDWAYLNEDSHAVSNKCPLCLAWFIEDVEPHHAPYAMPTGYASVDQSHHEVSNRCSEVNGCGRMFVEYPYVQCTFDRDWVLNSDDITTNGRDRVYCLYCSNATNVLHKFVPDGDTAHHCANGNGHIYEGHIWGASGDATNICQKCQWNKATHSRPDVQTTYTYATNFCANCASGSYRCYQVVRTKHPDETSETLETHCPAGWIDVAKRCGCYMCQSGVTGMCVCSYANIVYGPVFGPVKGSNE